jgi:multidrug resistance efflux pump
MEHISTFILWPSTDDAQVEKNMNPIIPRVAGLC